MYSTTWSRTRLKVPWSTMSTENANCFSSSAKVLTSSLIEQPPRLDATTRQDIPGSESPGQGEGASPRDARPCEGGGSARRRARACRSSSVATSTSTSATRPRTGTRSGPTGPPQGAPSVLVVLDDDTGLAAWSPCGGRGGSATRRG